MILDTNFLVALEREIRRGQRGAAGGFLASAGLRQFCVTPTIVGEMACGASMSAREAWESFFTPFRMLPIDARAAWQYGALYRRLAVGGQLIGSNDLWIAATALVHAMPVVTRNEKEFGRVPGLEVVSF